MHSSLVKSNKQAYGATQASSHLDNNSSNETKTERNNVLQNMSINSRTGVLGGITDLSPSI